jgi:hypothetical protein
MKPVKIALLTPILLGFLCATVSAQKFSYRSWLIKEISKDTAFKGRLNIILRPGSKPFFWPEDGPYKSADYNFQNEHLVKSKTGFLTVIEGTGRVYKIELDENEKDGLKFTRLDSTSLLPPGYPVFTWRLWPLEFSLALALLPSQQLRLGSCSYQ